jgi:hypothetical protein
VTSDRTIARVMLVLRMSFIFRVSLAATGLAYGD